MSLSLSLSRVTSQSTTSEVQGYMNTASREERWMGNSAALWRLLIRARKEFIKDQLATIGVTENELRQLEEIRRYRLMAQLEEAFITSFFDYSRDRDWMQHAVGETRDWIVIDGIAAWHVRAALADLKRTNDKAAASALALPPFDVLKDSAEQNTIP